MFQQRIGPVGADGSASTPDAGDARLVGRVAERDVRAYEDLYRQYYPRLSHFLTNIVRRGHLVDEVLNDTLLVVWRNAPKFNGRSKVSTWIFAIAYRRALKALKRHADPVEDRQDRESNEAAPDQLIEQRQTRALLMNAINQLSTEQRTVVDLTYFHEMSYREIAEIMGCPIDTVKTRMFHARRRLKSQLSTLFHDLL